MGFLTSSFSSPVLLLATSCLVLQLSPALALARSQEVLEAVKCRAQFPTGTYAMSSISVGNGKIYLFGGWTSSGPMTNDIYLYDVYGDSLTRVGELPAPTNGCAVLKDGQENLLHFGGSGMDTIVRFNTSSNITEVVGRLPFPMSTIGALKVKADSALVFGGVKDILEVDLTTLQVTPTGRTTGRVSGVGWDGDDDKVLLLGGHAQHQLYSISGNDLYNFTSPEPHHFQLYHSVISTPKSAWVVGNLGIYVGRGNGIFQVDFETLEFTFWPVANYPAGYNETFVNAATTYVPELNRLYIFGGYTSNVTSNGIVFRDIWYIDLPEERQVTTTSSPTFDCSNKPDGFYASRYACGQYFRCIQGSTFEFQCPPPLHFNPELQVCDSPEAVGCDLD